MMHKVLLIEDDSDDAELIRRELKDCAVVTLARSPEQFFQSLESADWDAVLLDWRLPRFDGFEALQRIATLKPDVPSIVVSGMITNQEALAAMNAGAKHCVPKEFLALLVPAIEAVVRERGIARQLLRMQRMENISSLATGITHDLNNLLSHVSLASGLVQRSCSEEHRKILKKTDATIERATALVQHLVTFARGEDVNLQSVLDVKELLQDVVFFLQETSPKSIKLSAQIADVPPIKGNRTQIQQVLQNLLVNARDALGNDEGFIKIVADKIKLEDFTVSTSTIPVSGEFVRISIEDSNGGIPEAILPHIFQLFYTTKTKGSGIGLSTVRSIMHSHRGHIDVTTHIGIGSTFTLLFPVQLTVLPLPVVLAALPRGNGELILLVDDELSILDVMTHILEGCNYRVLATGSSSEALALYRKRSNEIALVVSDVQMDSMSGVKLAALLRRSNPNVKIVFISGADTPERRSAKADAFLLKPFSADLLLATLGRLCGGVDKVGGS